MDEPHITLHRRLGAGGFGEVYLATQRTDGGLTREVAVKVLHEPLDEESDAVRRLRDEGQLLALLAHPAILGVHEFARVDGRLALITEYVPGVDLAWFCAPERRMPLRIALLVCQAVAEALDHAWHALDPATGKALHLIHRDIKPENVRLSTAGLVKLLDFGVARSTEVHRRAKTAAGTVVLTPGYGAPETLAFGVTGPAVDVFALGAVLFALVTCEPFYASPQLGAHVALAMDSVDWREHLDGRLALVDDVDLRSLLRDMLEFAHEHRPSMDEVAERCDRIARRLDGPSLTRWARGLPFPAPGDDPGPLGGRAVTRSGRLVDPSPDAPAAPDPPPKLSDVEAATWVEPPEPPLMSEQAPVPVPDPVPEPIAAPAVAPRASPQEVAPRSAAPSSPAPGAEERAVGAMLVVAGAVLFALGGLSMLAAAWVFW